MSADKSKISQIAYRIWEEEGRPVGRDLDHWLQAETAAKSAQPKAVNVEKPKGAKATSPKAAKAEKPKAVKSEKSKAAAKPKAVKAAATAKA